VRLARDALTTDHYKTLGLLPGAEDAVIRAAYRALMRIYHPDANSTPEAQERAKAIAAAYAVLGDPAARAEYDDEIGLITSQYPGDYSEPARAKPLRAAGIASIAVAAAAVLLLFSWERPAQFVPKTGQGNEAQSAAQPPAEMTLIPPSPNIEPIADPAAADLEQEAVDIDPMLKPAPPIIQPKAMPLPTMQQARRTITEPEHKPRAPPKSATPAREQSSAQRSAAPGNLAKVESIAAGFFDQSWTHANAAKQKLLLASRDRSVASRKLCRTDQCATEAYLRQMRETSAIMEGRPLPAQ
jgi:hypothetical protein